jgi:hypothetical protein
MADEADSARNPLFIPEKVKPKTGCPKCGHPDYDGRVTYGVQTFFCKNPECKNVWHGAPALPPIDPRVPNPPPPRPPPLTFDKALRQGSPHTNPAYITTDVVEVRHPQDMRPDFRRGLPIPDDDEELY